MATIQEAQMLVEIIISFSSIDFSLSHLTTQCTFASSTIFRSLAKGHEQLRKDAHFGWNKVILLSFHQESIIRVGVSGKSLNKL